MRRHLNQSNKDSNHSHRNVVDRNNFYKFKLFSQSLTSLIFWTDGGYLKRDVTMTSFCPKLITNPRPKLIKRWGKMLRVSTVSTDFALRRDAEQFMIQDQSRSMAILRSIEHLLRDELEFGWYSK